MVYVDKRKLFTSPYNALSYNFSAKISLFIRVRNLTRSDKPSSVHAESKREGERRFRRRLQAGVYCVLSR